MSDPTNSGGAGVKVDLLANAKPLRDAIKTIAADLSKLQETIDKTLSGNIGRTSKALEAFNNQITRQRQALLDNARAAEKTLGQYSKLYQLGAATPQARLTNAVTAGQRENLRSQTASIDRQAQAVGNVERATLRLFKSFESIAKATEAAPLLARMMNKSADEIAGILKAQKRLTALATQRENILDPERRALRQLGRETNYADDRNNVAFRARQLADALADSVARIKAATGNVQMMLAQRDQANSRARFDLGNTEGRAIARRRAALTLDEGFEDRDLREARARARLRSSTLSPSQMTSSEYELLRLQADRDNLAYDMRNQRMRQQEQARAAAREAQTPTSRPSREQRFAQIRRDRYDMLSGDGGAALFQIQSRLMVNYMALGAVFNALRFSGQFAIEFDKNMRQLQAITGSSEQELKSLGKTILDVGSNFHFSAQEIAQATVMLAQAGLSTQQISETLPAILRLASATGTDLKTAVDVATTAMSVFKIRADQMDDVANALSASLNRTKLSMEQVQLAFQYVANTAAESNVTFNELLAVIGQIANAGIRSGSTIGTGLRQFMVDVTAPTEELRKQLARFNLTVEDVNIKTQGLVGVLRNLRDAGFDSAAAFKGLEVRAAASYLALKDRVDDIAVEQQIQLMGGNARVGAESQMKALANQFERMKNAWGQLVSISTERLISALTTMTSATADTLKTLSRYPEVIATIGMAIAGAVAASGIVGIMRFIGGAAALLRGGAAGAALGARLGVVGAGVGAVAGGLYGIFGGKSDGNDPVKALDEAQGAVERTSARFREQQDAVNGVQEEIKRYTERVAASKATDQELLATIIELEQKFGKYGFTIDRTKMSVDSLLESLNELSVGMRAQEATLIPGQIQALRLEASAAQNLMASQYGSNSLDRYLGMFPESIRNRFVKTRWEGGLSGDYATTKGLEVGSMNGADPILVQALGLAMTGGAPRSDVSYRFGIQAVENRIRELSQSPEMEKTNADTILAMKALIEEIKKLMGLANTVQRSGLQQGLLSTEYNRAIQFSVDERQGYASVLQGFGSQFVRDRDAVSRTKSIFQRNAMATALTEDIGKGISEYIDSLRKQMTPDKFAAWMREFGGDFTSLQGRVGAFVDSIAETGADITKGVLEQQASNFDRQSKLFADRVSTRNRRDENERLIGLAVSNLQAAQSRRMQIMSQREAEIRRGGGPGLEELLRERALQVQEDRVAVDQLKERLYRTFNAPAREINVDLIRAREMGPQRQAITRARELELARAETPVRVGREQLNSLDLPINRTRISEGQREDMRLQQETRETEALAAQVRIQAQTEERLNALLRQQTDERDALTRKVIDYRNELEDENIAVTRRTQIETLLRNSEQALSEAQNQSKQTADELTSTTEKLTLAREQLTARTTPVGEYSFNDAMSASIRKYQRDSGALNSSTKQIADALPEMFRSMEQGIAGAAKGIASSSRSIADSIKDMSRRIVESMLDIAANALAKKLMGNLLSFGLGLLGGGDGQAGAPIDAASGNVGLTGISFGGPRAAGGPIDGPIKNKDSVLTPTMPGEWVVKKDSVDAVGPDFMRALNDNGAAALNAYGNRITPVAVNNRGGGEVNVYVVAPDQKPVPGPRDIVAIIGDDIARGGTTKKLIKNVQMGAI